MAPASGRVRGREQSLEMSVTRTDFIPAAAARDRFCPPQGKCSYNCTDRRFRSELSVFFSALGVSRGGTARSAAAQTDARASRPGGARWRSSTRPRRSGASASRAGRNVRGARSSGRLVPDGARWRWRSAVGPARAFGSRWRSARVCSGRWTRRPRRRRRRLHPRRRRTRRRCRLTRRRSSRRPRPPPPSAPSPSSARWRRRRRRARARTARPP